MMAAARSQFTTLNSLPLVGAEWAQAWVITKAGRSPRFIDSATDMMWWPPVRESPVAPLLSFTPAPPKLRAKLKTGYRQTDICLHLRCVHFELLGRFYCRQEVKIRPVKHA